MKKFTLTEANKKAMYIFSLDNYKITFGNTVYDDGTRTFSIHKDKKKRYGCSSTRMLTPKFAIIIITDDARKKGFEKGKEKLQKSLKELMNIN